MFCRFLEVYLGSAFHAGCAIRIIATNIRGANSVKQRVGDLAMRTGTSDILSQGHSGRLRLDARLRRARKPRNYRIDLEGLESRTLLATIPAATPTTAAPMKIWSASATKPAGSAISNSPYSLPFEEPTHYPLVVNLKVAKSTGISLPNDFLALADEVIE